MTDTYSLLRAFADSWMLLGLTAFFVGVVFWAFRPGSRELHREAAASILRDDTAPPRVAGCENACADCTCTKLMKGLT